jgi:hypothetical protein
MFRQLQARSAFMLRMYSPGGGGDDKQRVQGKTLRATKPTKRHRWPDPPAHLYNDALLLISNTPSLLRQYEHGHCSEEKEIHGALDRTSFQEKEGHNIEETYTHIYNNNTKQ